MQRASVAASLLLLALLLVYGSAIGHGFIQDDFRWIETSREAASGGPAGLLRHEVGFYRPLVAATFALNHAAFGMAPLGYALTNAALFLASACLLFLVARRLGLSAGCALLSAGLWAFNFHAVNMALLWLSGRTALLVCATGLATALCMLERRHLLAGVCCLMALLSKEEAVLLPFMFAAWLAWGASGRRRGLAARLAPAWPLFAALAIYAVLRAQTGAFGPATAPPYYRLTIAPAVVLRNILEYLDRGATVAAVASLLLIGAARSLPSFDERERRVFVFAMLWFVAGYGVTVFVPVRSSLYALVPSIGACLAAGAVGSALLRATPRPTRLAFAAMAVLPLLLVPVYRARNARWIQTGALSAHALHEIRLAAALAPETRSIVLVDNRGERVTLDAAFGSLLPEALRLTLGPGYHGEIVADDAAARSRGGIVLRLIDGRLEPYSTR